MSEPMPDFVLLRPGSLDEAVADLERHAGSRFIAGGTDLIANLRRGLVESEVLVDITGVPELSRLQLGPDGLVIGAAVTLARLAAHVEIGRRYPAVAQAAEAVAGPGHRTAATVGGNLCLDTRCLYYNQSHWWRQANSFCLKYKGDTCHVAPQGARCRAAFAGDLAPALIVHGAEVEIAGPGGRRRIALEELYRNDGAAHLTLEPGELLVAVHLPAADVLSAYAKVRVRGSIDFPLAGVAMGLAPDGGGHARLRVAITGTDSGPILLSCLDEPWAVPPDSASLARLDKLVQKQVSPMRTTTASSHYRRLAAAALARRLFSQLAARSEE
ncbi:MAG: 4-hydroxybenzoyl-CoA reductase subunit beta [Hyphomicrobiaceae bacterium]|nr:4-hydroxybenzoyl-CoA reductase subunit beta [Hyphomicrobiaceae bacterium]